jgi:3',5'-nucleoside bisphosphate phosphatase
MSYIDLHMHSSYSDDGKFDPKTLVNLCLDRKIKYFSIAYHNCVKVIDEAKAYSKDKKVEIIPAVELDCIIVGSLNLYLLGYGIEYHD